MKLDPDQILCALVVAQPENNILFPSTLKLEESLD